MRDDDDIQLQSYQDDLNVDDNATDPLMEEVGEDPATELGIPSAEFKNELDKTEVDDEGVYKDDDNVDIHDNRREYIEDLDEDSNDKSYRG